MENDGLEIALRLSRALEVRDCANNTCGVRQCLRIAMSDSNTALRLHLRCWKIALVASADGGLQVARDFLRQRSASDERMLITTVRLSGWFGFEVLNSENCLGEACRWIVQGRDAKVANAPLAAARCWSLGAAAIISWPAGAGAMSGPSACWAAVRMTSCGIIRACCMPADISLGSERTDIFVRVCECVFTKPLGHVYRLTQPTLC